MAHQERFTVRTAPRGMADITKQVGNIVQRSNVATGLAHVFVLHTSCALVVTENADPSVRGDLEALAQRWAPDGDPAYRHDIEGDDDMAAHARSVLSGTSVTIPVSGRQLLLGTWQGIYLWEHRAQAHTREIVVTVVG